MKRWTCLLLAALLLLTPAMALEQPTDEELKISTPSAILMERSTGTVLYEKNADEHLSPASVLHDKQQRHDLRHAGGGQVLIGVFLI